MFTIRKVYIPLICSMLLVGFNAESRTKIPDRLVAHSTHYDQAEKSLFLSLFRKEGRLFAAGERGTIVFSDDDGATWEQAKVPVSVMLTSIFFPEANEGWAVGHGGVVLFSEDAGETWTKQLDGTETNQMALEEAKAYADELRARFEAASEDERYDLEYDMEDAEFAQSDAEADVEIGPSKPLLDVWFKDEMHGLAVGAYGLFVETKDGGASWQYIASRLDNIDRFHLNAITQLDNGDLYIVGEAGLIFRSSDLGESWDLLTAPYDGSLFGVVGASDKNGVLVFGLRGNAFYSDDQGYTWNPAEMASGATLASAAKSQQGELIMVGHTGTVLVSNDAGKSFRQLEMNTFESFNAVLPFADGSLLLASESGLIISKQKFK